MDLREVYLIMDVATDDGSLVIPEGTLVLVDENEGVGFWREHRFDLFRDEYAGVC